MLYKCNFICYIAVIHAVPLLGVEMEEVFQVDLGNIVDDVLMLAAGHVLLAAVHNLSVRNGVSVLVVLDLSYVGLNCSKSLGAVSSCTIVSFTVKRKLSAYQRWASPCKCLSRPRPPCQGRHLPTTCRSRCFQQCGNRWSSTP